MTLIFSCEESSWVRGEKDSLLGELKCSAPDLKFCKRKIEIWSTADLEFGLIKIEIRSAQKWSHYCNFYDFYVKKKVMPV